MSSTPTSSSAFNFKPLLISNMVCSMTMMAFIAILGPIASVVGLAPWQAGTIATAGGVLWMATARLWGQRSDHHGRRTVLLQGVNGFLLSNLAMCALLILSLQFMPSSVLIFLGMLLARSVTGAFYATIPTVGQALVADNVQPAQRTATLAALGAANAAGLVLGPALAASLTHHSLAAPLYLIAVLPVVANFMLWRYLPKQAAQAHASRAAVALHDPRLRGPMTVAFVAMLCVAIAQITIGFFAIDQLRLNPTEAAQAAGTSLTLVGIGLILTQIAVRQLNWPPKKLIRTGAVIGVLGFASAAISLSTGMLATSFLVVSVGTGCIFPAFAALASNAVEPHEQGAAAGSIGAAQGFGMVVGPIAGTLLYSLSPSVPYFFAALLLGVIAISRI